MFHWPGISSRRPTAPRRLWAGGTLNAFGSVLTLRALAWLLLRTYPAQPLLAALVPALGVQGKHDVLHPIKRVHTDPRESGCHGAW